MTWKDAIIGFLTSQLRIRNNTTATQNNPASIKPFQIRNEGTNTFFKELLVIWKQKKDE